MSSEMMIPASAEEKALAAESDRLAQGLDNVFGDLAQFENAQRIARLLAASDCVPEQYQKNVANCVVAIDIANRMGMSPLSVMQNLYIVKGKPSWSGQACRALIKNDGTFVDDDLVYVGEPDTDSWGCYLVATNAKTGKVVKGATVTIGMAKKEGWYSKTGSKWQTMPELMLAYRAAAFFAKANCPSAMMGFQTYEELKDIERADRAKKTADLTADILGG